VASPAAIEKPTVFLSHAATDQPVARVIHDEIRRIFANGVTVYASSVPGVVKPGQDWLASIRDNLTAATAVIVLVTPISINRPWIWFEVGASWSKMEQGAGLILPLCYGVEKGDLPEPLGRLQAMSLSKAAETKEVFRSLVDTFGFGNMKGFRHTALTAKLPKYNDIPVAESDLRSGTLYDGPFEGYSDAELREVIDDNYLHPRWSNWREFSYHKPRSNLFNGKLVHFREFDADMGLPPGAGKRLLEAVATSRYPTKAVYRTENTVRFSTLTEDEEDRWLESQGDQDQY
jgi:hypothetical protein